MKKTLTTLFLAAIVDGCGDPTAPPSDAGADTGGDVSADVPVDAPPVDAPPVDAPPVDDAGAPARCAAGTACAAEYALRCRGEVRAGVCYAAPPLATSTYERDGWVRSAVTLPTDARIDASQTVVFSLRNATTAARPLAWRVNPLGGWVIESEDPPSGSTREVPAGASVQVTVRMHPTVANALDPSRQVAATVGIDGVESRGGWPLFIPVG